MIELYDIIESFDDMDEFDAWLRTDIYGIVHPTYNKDILLYIMNKLLDKRGLEDKLIHVLKKLDAS